MCTLTRMDTKVLLVVLVMTSVCCVEGRRIRRRYSWTRARRTKLPLALTSWTIDNWNVQSQMKKPGEVDGTAQQDLDWDLSLTGVNEQPEGDNKFPKEEELDALYESEKSRLMMEAEGANDDLFQTGNFSVKATFQYYTQQIWSKIQRKCCPARVKYQCVGTNVRFPCFYEYNEQLNDHVWCCPVWPRHHIRRCDCCKCAILTSECAMTGSCRRRYSKKSFVASCYRNNGWTQLQYMTKSIPTSCYCNIDG